MLFIANYQYISSMRAVRKKHFSNDEKRAAIELWRAKIPLKDIRKQLEMSESTLRRILAFAKASPLPQGEDGDSLVQGQAQHPAYQGARQQSRSESD